MKPLDGVVVLDLTRFLAGPYCTLLLAGLGAEVIRIEPPAGDDYRRRPPFGGAKGASFTRRTDADLGMTVLHRWRDKKSVTLNLRDPAGVDLFLRLAARADVVVENFLPGTLAKMGLGFPVLEAANPRLVLCSISGFGQRGPYREWRAFDPIVQGMSGVSSITGYPDRPPVRAGASISDTGASLYGVIGILSALRARERTGTGDWVDVAMLDGTFFMLAEVLEFVTSGIAPERRGNGHQGTVPFNVYRARDGWVSLCVVTADEWRGVLASLGRPELLADPRFGPSPETRRAHRDEIDALVQEWIGQRTVAEAITTLQAHHVPAGPVLDLPDVFGDAHMREREMVVELTHPTAGPVPGAIGAGMPIKFLRHPAAFDAPAPTLGAHNADVYGRLLGLGAEDLEKLRAAGLI
ncbi:MAG: CoA transferase [Candidatus Rokubacteria bacterium]|nr:CoA transferase [Candidatus Rokubacteria bacterium]